jgi:thiamine thiazole synthase
MKIEDIRVSRAIIQSYFERLNEAIESDVILVGGGPANLACAYFLAREGKKTVLFERRLAPGGGMWGGGMMFSQIVVQPSAQHLLDEFGIKYEKTDEGLLHADSVHATSALVYHATLAGAQILNSIAVEDVMIEENRIQGVVLNWKPVVDAKLHVDPLTVRAKAVVDGTGHDARICNLVARRGLRLNTASGTVAGEGAMLAETGEKMVVENTGEIFPGLYLLGMAVAATFGSPRMGPIFGGMLLSGEKLAKTLISTLK